MNDWKKCPSAMTGGKAFFYVKPLSQYHGYRRVHWDREVSKYVAVIDSRYSDNQYQVGCFDDVKQAMTAADAYPIR